MSWAADLSIRYRQDPDRRTRALDRHVGPLRVLKALYPEGDGICHHTLVHPPGGVAGGDTLHIDLHLEPHTHAVLTTPGATRFYRTRGPWAGQTVQARLEPDARLEWLPLESIAHDASRVRNHQRFQLLPGAEMIGWDVLALGLPAADDPWRSGCFEQTIDVVDTWLEQGRIEAGDRMLLDSPLGWAGHRVLGTMWWASGTAQPAARTVALVEAARAIVGAEGLAGVTSPDPRTVVLRMLAPRVEPVMQAFVAVRNRWRALAWQQNDTMPRVWQT